MSGSKASARYAEIDISGVTSLDGSAEFARMWSKPGGPVTCLIEPRALGPDPALFGMAMVDCLRHAGKAYAFAVGVSEAEAMERIWLGFDAERGNSTDVPRQIDPGNLN